MSLPTPFTGPLEKTTPLTACHVGLQPTGSRKHLTFYRDLAQRSRGPHSAAHRGFCMHTTAVQRRSLKFPSCTDAISAPKYIKLREINSSKYQIVFLFLVLTSLRLLRGPFPSCFPLTRMSFDFKVCVIHVTSSGVHVQFQGRGAPPKCNKL